MIINKLFELFYKKIFIIASFLLYTPFLLYAVDNDNPDNKRYTYQIDLISREYIPNRHYLPYCGDDNSTGKDWITYPFIEGISTYPTCLKKRYCSDLKDDGSLYFTTPGYDSEGNTVINCYRKSCLDLTENELKAIFKQQYGVDAEDYFANNNANISSKSGFYKFCEPVKYTISNNIKIQSGSIDPVYCHEFPKATLKYLIPNIRNIHSSGIGKEEVYQCLLHQCPISNNMSMTCKTNFWLFSDKSINKRIRSNDYIAEYERKILNNASYSIDSKSNNDFRNTACTDINCSQKKYSTQLVCTGTQLNPDCDEYIGLDKNFQSNKNYINLKKSVSDSYNEVKQSCNSGYCQKTIDCSLSQNLSHPSCFIVESSQNNSDQFLSYFYRPFPSQSVTEILKVNKSWITNDTLSNNIYNDSFKNNNDYTSNITAIKRLMRGIIPKPLTDKYTDDFIIKYSAISNQKNYFNYIGKTALYENNRANICINNIDDFKNYGNRIVIRNNDKGTWKEGEYYRASLTFLNGRYKFGTIMKPHLIPLCDIDNKLTTYSSREGFAAFCHNGYNIDGCSTPFSDSYYIKSKPQYGWKTDSPELDFFTVTACLRKKDNNGNCGERECYIQGDYSCDKNGCSAFEQSCGADSCVELTWREDQNCKLSNLGVNDCIKIVSENGNYNKIRFRLDKVNNKFYVFVDAINDLSCSDTDIKKIKAKKMVYFRKPPPDSYNSSNFTITEYKGRINDKNLLDDNNLIDHNGDGYINDQDVFGEELYQVFNCETNNKKNECSSMSTKNVESNKFEDNKWITWDIIQYIGNNQPTENNPNCKVGKIKNCRGYYDAEGKFYKEQQGMSVPLAVSPNFFYKYATIENSSNLLLPLLKITRVITSDNIDKILKYNNEDNDIALSFFKPSMTIEFGATQGPNISVPFNKISISDTLEEITKGITIDYKIKKTATGGKKPIATVCLNKVIGKDSNDKDIEETIKCLKRKNPEIDSIVIKNPSSFYNETKPYVNVFFIDKNKIDKNSTSAITLNDENSIPFVNFKNEKKLYPESYGKSHEYPIYITKSRCSTLHYECIENKSILYRKKTDLQKEKKAVIPNKIKISILNSEILELNNKMSFCERNIQTYCDQLSGGTYSKSELRNENTKDTYFLDTYYNSKYVNIRLCYLNPNSSEYCTKEIKEFIDKFEKLKKDKNISFSPINDIPKNYNLIGSTSDICISSGFDEYFPYVMAIKSVDGVLGKCILNANSKKNPACRRSSYYSFCTDNSDPLCICINGTANCDCTNEETCVKKNYCNCSGENCENLLPEECFLPGFNGYNTVLKSDNTFEKSCICEYNTDGIARTGMEVRKATPRELGLCANLNTPQICKAVKYYDENRIYNDGGEGNRLNIIKNKYKSNIWRTEENIMGKYNSNNLGHAEFDSSIATLTVNAYNIQKEYCYNEDTGYSYLKSNDENCDTGYVTKFATTGECKGFWKNKTIKINNEIKIINPLAVCFTDFSEFDLGDNVIKQNATFNLYKNTECERYSCPFVNEGQSNYATEDEKNRQNTLEINSSTANYQGLSNGFANWTSYKKGSYDIRNNKIITTNNIENEYGDDIEQRTAESCIQGYAPAGFGKILYKYFPVKFTKENNIDKDFNKEIFIKNMLLNSEDFVSKGIMYNTLAYNAKNHLPTRYCNQIGQWMPVDDIYTRLGIDLYNINSKIFHNDLDSNGFVNINKYKTKNNSISETNTYGENINYSKKYCERLFCKEINHGDIILFKNKEKNPVNQKEGKFYLTKNNDIIKYYKNEINNATYWKHSGGAIWKETPAPLKNNNKINNNGSITVYGTCDSLTNHFPNGAKFMQERKTEGNLNVTFSSFSKQHNNLFSKVSTNEVNPRILDLISNNDYLKPERECSKWGIWGEIKNECTTACEPLDPFRTNFSDNNNDGKIQNNEIIGLYKLPHLRNNYFKRVQQEDGSILSQGDEFTGGAQWGRTLAGEYAIGECDSSISKGKKIINGASETIANKNITFIRSGTILDKIGTDSTQTGGRPYRECLEDGTWGPIHNPCILYNSCPEKEITNRDILRRQGSGTVLVDKNVGLLNSESLLFENIKENMDNLEYTVNIKSSCDSRYYQSGEITQECLINNSTWKEGTFNSTCQLKTCGEYIERYGNIDIARIPANKYYAQESGFNNSVQLNGKKYNGYKLNKKCPDNFICKDCEENSGELKYTCNYDKNDNKLKWNVDGYCEPVSCPFENLQKVCKAREGCGGIIKKLIIDKNGNPIAPIEKDYQGIGISAEKISNLIKNNLNIKFINSNSKYDSQNDRFAVGSYVKLTPKNGYKYNTDEVQAYCGIDGYWRIKGNFEISTCNDNYLHNVDNAIWNAAVIAECPNKNKPKEGLSCPNTIKTLKCNDGYSANEKISMTCTLNYNTGEANWVKNSTGDLKCYKDCSAGSIININKLLDDFSVSCKCPILDDNKKCNNDIMVCIDTKNYNYQLNNNLKHGSCGIIAADISSASGIYTNNEMIQLKTLIPVCCNDGILSKDLNKSAEYKCSCSNKCKSIKKNGFCN